MPACAMYVHDGFKCDSLFGIPKDPSITDKAESSTSLGLLLDPTAPQPQPMKQPHMFQSPPQHSASSQLLKSDLNMSPDDLQVALPGAALGTASGKMNGGVKMVLALDMEMKDIKGIEDSFKQAVALDLADAVAGMREKIDIVGVQPGSIPYTLVVFAGNLNRQSRFGALKPTIVLLLIIS